MSPRAYGVLMTYCRKRKLLQSHGGNEKVVSSASRLAESLETILFSQSNKSIDAYQTPESMNKNLKALVHALQLRRQKARTTQRTEFLRKTLGPEKHSQIKRLVEQIKLARLEKVGENCAQCRRLDDGSMLCPSKPTKGNDGSNKKFPSAVHSLFFDVNLINALEFKSLQTWRDTKWDDLIEEAQEILRNYHNWRTVG